MHDHTHNPVMTAPMIIRTTATAAQKYGGGTIRGASAFSAATLSAKVAVSLASVAALPALSLRAASVDSTALPSTCAVHRPTPTLNPPPMSQPINATIGAVKPPSDGRYPSPWPSADAIRRPHPHQRRDQQTQRHPPQ